jgi:PadR family transcriptional regulator, regulatory protein PadR
VRSPLQAPVVACGIRYLALQGSLCYPLLMNTSTFGSQMRRGAVEFCVLALLARREHYGFELVQRLSDADGLLTSEGTIYPLLSRLRRDRLVETEWRESSSGPPRKYYRLTKQGDEALGMYRKQWALFRDAVDTILQEGQEALHDL